MDCLEYARTEVSFIPMIEDPSDVEKSEEILAVFEHGRDLVMFGKADYGQALGTLNRDGSYTSANRSGMIYGRRCLGLIYKA